ncbi:MAG: 3-dehydroquinate synthase [Bacteroidota bacterium]
MKTIEIHSVSQPSKVLIGEKAKNYHQYIPPGTPLVFITDKNLKSHYPHLFQDYPVVEIGLGEKNKTFETLEYIFSQFIELEVDRSTYVVAVGGGIVCDVAGFAASIYMRGLRFGFISTSLLSQVDASVGGKNGVNFTGYKNMIGVFNQPEFVICDINMLKTLDSEEFYAGFAEIIKAGAIRDATLFEYLEKNASEALDYNEPVLEKIISDSIAIKARVVENDEREKGERRVLNFGHTFAHAIEKLTGMLHGKAVSIGMALAASLSVKLGYLSSEEKNRIIAVLDKYHLPVECTLSMKDIIIAMKKDKKREGSDIHFVLLDRIGNAFTEKKPLNELEDLLHDLC